MALVRVKTKFQVTLPTAVRRQVGIGVGDLLEAKAARGRITLTPKLLVDREIEEGLEDIEQGRVYGPFDSAEGMIRSLHQYANRVARKRRARR
jgi:AbrB family looped-hinge helix DNA binding protein